MERSLTPHPLFVLRATARLGAAPGTSPEPRRDAALPARAGAAAGAHDLTPPGGAVGRDAAPAARRRPPRAVRRGALAGAIVAVVAGGSADAATRYVATTGSDLVNTCSAQATPCKTVQRALNQAAEGETVQIAAGEYQAPEAFTAKLVHLRGAGAGRAGEPFDPAVHTLLRGSHSAALELDGGGSIASLRLAGDGTADDPKHALVAFATGTAQQTLTLTDVHATCGAATTPGKPGGRAVHAAADDDAGLVLRAERTTLHCETGTSGRPLDALPNVQATITGSDLRGVHGAFVAEGGSLTVDDSTVHGRHLGLVNGGGTLAVHRSRVTAGIAGVSTASDDQDAPPRTDVHDSLVHVTTLAENGQETSAAVLLRGDNPQAHVGVHASTLALDGTGDQTGGVVVTGTDGAAQGVALADTAVHAPSAPDLAVLGGPATITAARSAFADSIALTGAGSVPQPTLALTASAGFRDPAAGDFQLTPGSPLLDEAAPADPAARDLTGGARAQDGDGDGVATPDIGAFECAACAPAPAPAPAHKIAGPETHGLPGPPARQLDLIAPKLSKVTFEKHTFSVSKGTILSWHLSEAATVEIEVARKTKGAKRHGSAKCRVGKTQGIRCWRYMGKGTVTRKAAAGDTKMRFTALVRGKQLPPGAYRARLTAVDAAGNRGNRQTLTFAVRPAAR